MFAKWWNDHLKGMRTVVIAGALLLIDALQATDLAPLFPGQWQAIWTAAQPVLMIYLRFITTTPFGAKR